MASLLVAKNKVFIFSTDHCPSLLLTGPTSWSSPSWPIPHVYFLPNTITCLKPTLAETKKSVIRNQRVSGAMEGWLQQNYRSCRNEAASLFQWGVKTQTDLWWEKPKQTFLPKLILYFFKRCVVRTLPTIFDNFSSQGSFWSIKNSFPGLLCSKRQNTVPLQTLSHSGDNAAEWFTKPLGSIICHIISQFLITPTNERYDHTSILLRYRKQHAWGHPSFLSCHHAPWVTLRKLLTSKEQGSFHKGEMDSSLN